MVSPTHTRVEYRPCGAGEHATSRALESGAMAQLSSSSLRLVAIWLVALALVAVACSEPATDDGADQQARVIELEDPPRRYSAEWLIHTSAIGRDDISSPFIYREVVDDLTGTYLVESPNHLALQQPDEVVLCAAVSRVPLNPYCAASPRAAGSPHVLSYPVQLIRRDWSPSALYDLASYREVALVAASDPDAWATQITTATSGFSIECFLVIGETSAATTDFEICYTNDDLHLVASVDLQSDLIFEIDLLSYERLSITEDFETGLDDFIEARPSLQEQLLDLYPEIPSRRPTPTPTPE